MIFKTDPSRTTTTMIAETRQDMDELRRRFPSAMPCTGVSFKHLPFSIASSDFDRMMERVNDISKLYEKTSYIDEVK